MKEYVVTLNGKVDEDLDPVLVGIKAAHLNQLIQAGLSVPRGFVVTTEAYWTFVAANGIEESIEESQQSRSVEGLEKAFLNGTFPKDLRSAILTAWQETAAGSYNVAVRSSATDEDRKDASFAGQYETVLGVDSEVDLLWAIRRCWASLWNERVLDYRDSLSHSIGQDRPAMAVIVQCQIPSEVSGVLFTLNPSTGRENEMVVEAIWGLGEGLVGGLITPDRYVADVWQEQVVHRQIADKRVMITSHGQEEVPEEKRLRSSLNDEQTLELTRLGYDVQAVFGYPQDIEWAFHGGTFYILQARPLTRFTFAPDVGEWTSVNLQEVLPGFVSIISQSLSHTHGWDPAIEELFLRLSMMSEPRYDVRWTGLFFGRAYWNAGIVKEYNALLPGFEELAFDRTVGIPPSYEGKGRVTGFTPRSMWRGLPVLLALNRVYRAVWEEAKAYSDSFCHRQETDLDQADPRSLGDKQLKAHVRCMIDLHCEANRIALLVAFLSTQAQDDFQRMVDDLNRIYPNRKPILVSKLLTGLSGVRTTEPLIKLWHISRQVNREPAIAKVVRESSIDELQQRLQSSQQGRTFWQHLEDYINEFRYMASSDEDLSCPRWDEDSSFVFRTLKVFVSGDGQENPEERIEAQRRIRQREERRAKARLSHSWNRLRFWRQRSFRNQLELVKRFCWWREETRVVAAWAFYYCRKALLEQGSRWAAQGVLNKTDDIFWMTKEDLIGLLDGIVKPDTAREIVRKFQRTSIVYRNFTPPPVIVGCKGLGPEKPLQVRKRFEGIPCGAGVVTGRAKVVLDLDEADKLEKGEILIAPYTNPGWTPLFSLAGGIIMEEGGLLSHGAVVARECGIPTVLQIPQATRQFHDGQVLRVNGDIGVVEIIDYVPDILPTRM